MINAKGQKGIITLPTPVYFAGYATVAGGHEANGPLADRFDVVDENDEFGKKTWEEAEAEMQRLAFSTALRKAGLDEHDIDAVFAGDLQNQCVASNYGLASFDIPYFGLYGACSTCTESLILASIFCAGGFSRRAAAVSSSHNSAAERQFRSPVEYGGQRAPTAQWTVTGAGAFIIGSDQINGVPYITDVLPGRTVDKGIDDISNMGAAMAPAAADTLIRYFKESGRYPGSFDMIVTGDLGYEGTGILRKFMEAEGYSIGTVHQDCGLLIYDRTGQDKHAGGSGCGCSAVVLAAYILPRMQAGELRDVLVMSTGALMSPSSVQQGNTIPGIGHLVHIVA